MNNFKFIAPIITKKLQHRAEADSLSNALHSKRHKCHFFHFLLSYIQENYCIKTIRYNPNYIIQLLIP